jgi:hypothetical protein
MGYSYEYTDTFGGEANYCWVKRGELHATTDLSRVREAKAAVGLSGVRCRREDLGDMIALYPYGICRVLFITWNKGDPHE